MGEQDTFWKQVVSLWEHVLWSIDGGHVTIGHVVVAILVLLVSVPIARILDGILRRRLKSETQLNPNSIRSLGRASFTSVSVIAIYIAIAVLRIPLTLFHFAVGGLAIGVGFGARNLFGNVVSGLVLMVQRPVEIGDVIESEGRIGSVSTIGLRSVLIHTAYNTDVFIPNASILNEALIN